MSPPWLPHSLTACQPSTPPCCQVPLGLRLGPLTVISCGLAMLPRMAKGSAYKKGSKLPKEPLVYW